jgi:hypothetical protein
MVRDRQVFERIPVEYREVGGEGLPKHPSQQAGGVTEYMNCARLEALDEAKVVFGRPDHIADADLGWRPLKSEAALVARASRRRSRI